MSLCQNGGTCQAKDALLNHTAERWRGLALVLMAVTTFQSHDFQLISFLLETHRKLFTQRKLF